MELDRLFSRIDLPIETEGGSFQLTLDPNRYTTEWHIKSFLRSVSYEELAEALSFQIVDWDLTRKGKPLPISVETLIAFPPPLLNRIHQEMQRIIVGYMNPQGDEDGAEKKVPDRSRNGSRSST